MPLSTLTQSQRTELRYVDVLQFVHITLPSDTVLYLCDFDYAYTYGSTTVYYDSYIQSINGLGNVVDIDGVTNPSINITIKNKPWNTYDYLILLSEDDEFTRADVSIYELRLTSATETFTTDDRVLLWRGNVAQVQSINRESFVLNCCSRLHNKKNAFGLNVIKEDDFPNSKPDDRGKYRNKIYGTVEKVVCRCVKDAAVDYLTTDMTATQTTVPISGVTKIPFPSSGTVQIDSEQISYSSVTYAGSRPTTLTGCTRGYSSTDAAIHDKGIGVGVVSGEFIYEVADHPVDSIDNVFVDDIRQTVSDPFHVYTGQTGNELAGYEDTAVVRFTAKPYVGKQVNVDVNDHEHVTTEGLHLHSSSGTSSSTTPAGSTATSVTDSGITVLNPTNANDNVDSSYATVTNSNSYPTIYEGGIEVPFTFNIPVSNRMTYVTITYRIRTTGTTQHTSIYYNGGWVVDRTGVLAEGNYTVDYGVSAAAGTYTDYVRIFHSGGGGTLYVHEVGLQVFYSATNTAESPATGVEAEKVGTTSLTGGTSTSTTVIGNEVTVDVDGYRDDTSGTYTGTASSVIKRPDHVFKHMLIALAGFTSGDLDSSSFTTAGSYYNTNTYNLGFVVNDVGTDSDKILSDLAYQIHSCVYEWFGKFYLKVLPSTTPTVDLIIDDNDILEHPEYEYTSLDDLVNLLKAYYLRDYRTSSGRGNTLEGVINPDAMAEGYLDVLESTIGDGDLEGSIKLSAVRTTAMAQKILDFWSVYKAIIRLKVRMKLRWKAIQMGPCQHFSYTDPIFGYKIFRVTEFKPNRSAGYIDVSGTESP